MYLLLLAVLVIAHLAMNKQHGEVRDIEIGDRRFEASWQRPRKRHEEVAAKNTHQKTHIISVNIRTDN